MKFFIVLFALLSVAFAGNIVLPYSTLVRSPQHDSAIIRSDRVNGNFAYSSIEGHAYKQITPIVRNLVRPVAVEYNAHYAPLAYANPIPYQASHTYVAY